VHSAFWEEQILCVALPFHMPLHFLESLPGRVLPAPPLHWVSACTYSGFSHCTGFWRFPAWDAPGCLLPACTCLPGRSCLGLEHCLEDLGACSGFLPAACLLTFHGILLQILSFTTPLILFDGMHTYHLLEDLPAWVLPVSHLGSACHGSHLPATACLLCRLLEWERRPGRSTMFCL